MTTATPRLSRTGTALLAIGVLLLAAILADRLFFGSSSDPAGTGSGHAATQARTVAPFTAVELAGANNVVMRVGEKQSVVVHADDNLLGRVTTRVRSGTLVIASTPGSLNARTPMYVTVTVPTLHALRLTGAGNISASGIDTPKLAVVLAGSGNIDAKGVAARDATATLRGSGMIMLTATRSLTAELSGSGSIFYGGSPAAVHPTITGTGTITPG